MKNSYWLRLLEVKVYSGSDVVKFVTDTLRTSRFEMHVTVPFSDEATPSESQVSIYNLTQKSINLFKKGNRVVIHAGYSGNDQGMIVDGTISSVKDSLLSGSERVTSFTVLEGKDYSEQKEVNIAFGNGTYADTIIARVAKEAGIPLMEVRLRNNKNYGSGFTADGQAMGILEEIAKACDTSIYFRRGSLIIKNFRDGNIERLVLKASTGLISQPTRVENGDYSGWAFDCLLQHKISTGTAISLDSKNVKGNFFVKSGQHSYDGSNFTTTCEVVS